MHTSVTVLYNVELVGGSDKDMANPIRYVLLLIFLFSRKSMLLTVLIIIIYYDLKQLIHNILFDR